MSEPQREHTRIKFKGGEYGEEKFEYFASIGARDLTDQEYDQLDDEQKEQIASRPDLYEDKGTAKQAERQREKQREERANRRAERSQRRAGAATATADEAPSNDDGESAESDSRRSDRDSDEQTSESEE